MYQIILKEYGYEYDYEDPRTVTCKQVVYFISTDLTGLDKALNEYERLCTQGSNGRWELRDNRITATVFNLAAIVPSVCICDPDLNYDDDVLNAVGNNIFVDENSYLVARAMREREQRYNDEWILRVKVNPLNELQRLKENTDRTFNYLKDKYSWNWD